MTSKGTHKYSQTKQYWFSGLCDRSEMHNGLVISYYNITYQPEQIVLSQIHSTTAFVSQACLRLL